MIVESLKSLARPISDLIPDAANARKHNQKNMDSIKNSLKRFGQRVPIVAQRTPQGLVVRAGNGRLQAAKELGWKEIAVVVVDEGNTDATAFAIADNRTAELAEWDDDALSGILKSLQSDWDTDIEELGFGEKDVWELLGKENPSEWNKLSDRFVVPPFSVLDTKQSYWIDRRRSWLGLGIESEKGRKEDLLNINESVSIGKNTSIFDPVLAEIMYRWFCPEGGKILDPFAGGSVRGIVAGSLGFAYHGNDLRQEQIDENVRQGLEINPKVMPKWTCGDSLNIDSLVPGNDFDFVFSCPPYFDLEQYSDDDRDLSNKDYEQFLKAYNEIIRKSVAKLKDNAFACFVVSEVRSSDSNGSFVRLVPDTIRAFCDAGMSFYNEIILLNSVGSVALRIGKIFLAGRKVGRLHQNVLVFFKGDIKKIVPRLEQFTETELESDADVLENL